MPSGRRSKPPTDSARSATARAWPGHCSTSVAPRSTHASAGQADCLLLRESLARSRAVGYREGEAWSRELLGLLAADEGASERGAQLLRESLRTHWALGDRWRSASVLEALAGVMADSAEAARLLGAA